MMIEYRSGLTAEFSRRPDRGRRWRLTAPFDFAVDGKVFRVPEGFWTDFASVPRVLWPVVSPYDLGVGPVPHDFGYFTGWGEREWWDEVLLACMERDRVPGWKRRAAFRAVHWFGGLAWQEYRRENPGWYVVGPGRGQGPLEVLNWGSRPGLVGRSAPAAMGVRELLWKLEVARAGRAGGER